MSTYIVQKTKIGFKCNENNISICIKQAAYDNYLLFPYLHRIMYMQTGNIE